MRVIRLIAGNPVRAIPVAMLLGALYGLVLPADWLRGLIVPMTFLMLYPMMVGLRLSQLGDRGGRRVPLVAQPINFGLIAFLACMLGLLFLADRPHAGVGLLLAGLLPTSGMTISWTGVAGGNPPAAIRTTVLDLVLGSLVAPLYLSSLVGALDSRPGGCVPADRCDRAVAAADRATDAHDADPPPRDARVPEGLGTAFSSVLDNGRAGHRLRRDRAACEPGRDPVAAGASGAAIRCELVPATLAGHTMLSRGDAVARAMNLFGTAGSEAALLTASAYVAQMRSAACSERRVDRVFGPKEG